MNPFKTTCRVIYADTDTMGFVYHTNYFRWFEIARNELFGSVGLRYKKIEKKGFFLPVTEVFCKFISPVEYDDIIKIDTIIDEKIKAGMKFNYSIFCENEKKLIAKGYTKHACLDKNNKVVRPPAFLKEITKSIIKQQRADK